jgi:large subunit ribosomal protein L29
MDFDEIKNKSVTELNEILDAKKEELRELRFRLQHQQLKQTQKFKEARRAIAKIKTLLNMKTNSAK